MSQTVIEHKNIKQDINADIISANKDESKIVPVPIDIKRKFLHTFFSSIEGSTVAKQDNINVAVIHAENPVELSKKLVAINTDMFSAYNVYLETEAKLNPKLVDRSIMYESEIKDNTLFIRWI